MACRLGCFFHSIISTTVLAIFVVIYPRACLPRPFFRIVPAVFLPSLFRIKVEKALVFLSQGWVAGGRFPGMALYEMDYTFAVEIVAQGQEQ